MDPQVLSEVQSGKTHSRQSSQLDFKAAEILRMEKERQLKEVEE